MSTGYRGSRATFSLSVSDAERSVELRFRLAGKTDIPELLELQLAIDADQAVRFGDDRYTTTISEKSIARSLKSSRMVVATLPRTDCRDREDGDEEAVGDRSQLLHASVHGRLPAQRQRASQHCSARASGVS